MQRIETQTGLVLSREVKTPNIASKGKLLPRTVQVPASLLLETPTENQSSESANPASKEQEVSDQTTPSGTPGVPGVDEGNRTEDESHEAFSQAILEMLKALPTAEESPLERIPSPTPSRKSIQDQGASTITSALDNESQTVVGDEAQVDLRNAVAPRWLWWREESGRLCIEVEVPELVRLVCFFPVQLKLIQNLTPSTLMLQTMELVRNSTLDVEPRRLLLCVPHMAPLDINMALADADMEQYWAGSVASTGLSSDLEDNLVSSNIRKALNLKRERDFDVDGAEAEWNVGSGVVVICV